MKLIRPTPIGVPELTSTDVAESAADYSTVTTYAKGGLAVRPSDHALFESQQDGNLNHSLDDLAWWVRIGTSNRWAAYDEYNQSQKQRAESFTDVLTLPGLINSIALLNLDAVSVDVTIEDAFEGVIFSETINLLDNSNVNNVFDYFFEPIVRKTDVVRTDLRPAYNPVITYKVNAPGGVAKLGNFIPGQVRTLGETIIAPNFGTVDHSKINEDDYGNTSVAERPYRKTAAIEVALTDTSADEVARLLTSRRAKPTVFIGSDRFSSLTVLGFPIQWRGLLDELEKFTLEIRGIT